MSQVGTLGLGPQPLTLLLEQAWVLLGNAPRRPCPSMHANGCGTLLSENFHVYWWPYLPQKDSLQSRHSYGCQGIEFPLVHVSG